jgi:hypothetical protein
MIVKAGSLGPNIHEANGKPPENPSLPTTPVRTPYEYCQEKWLRSGDVSGSTIGDDAWIQSRSTA